MKSTELRQKFLKFFEERGHRIIPSTSLVPPENVELAPTQRVLFTTAGMQPLIPYLLGGPHPQGQRLVNIQNCFRAADIDEVGDNRHTTFFRMLGNWSLGDYFKKEQIPWVFEFLTKRLNIDPGRLYVTIFKGYKNIPCDIESEKIWTGILENEGLDSKKHIFSDSMSQ